MKIWQLLMALGLIAGLLSCADYNLYDQYMKPQAVTLNVAGVADSSVTLQWSMYTGGDFKNYKIYKATHDGVDTTDSVVATFPFVNDTTMNITSLAPGHTYYFLVALNTNSGGFAASNGVHVTTPTQLGQFTLYDPDSISDSSLQLHWSRCTLNVTNYRIYADTAKQADSTSMLIKSVSSDTSTEITGLASGHRYWFRVYGLNNTTIIALSTSSQAYVPAIVKVNPAVLSITGVTDSSVSLKWSPYAGSDFKNYKVYYSLDDNVKTTDSLADSMMFNTDTIKNVQALLPATHYYFRVITNTQSGNILASNIKDTMTNTWVATKSIKILAPDSITESSVSLHWLPYTRAFDGYGIFADTLPTVDSTDMLVATPQKTDTQTTVSGLSANHSYWFRIYAQKAASNIAFSDSVKVSLKPSLTLFTPDTVDSSFVVMHWTKCTAPTDQYVVYADTVLEEKYADAVALSLGADTTARINGLTINHYYAFRVYAIKNMVRVAASNILAVKTK
jgi:Fibronectin type III domain